MDTTKRIGEAIADTCGSVFGTVQDALVESMPDVLEISFGVSVSAEGGMPLVGRAGMESTFSVTATWNK
ncbi:CU044_2847 family protein [Cryobacterium sp. GrIS_2_6]|uniref:CU044_2847 family protein n=1 Tax=Cryobacterium sp. GrIS_2_6 TaxID=3162785 RepID=UPI0034DD03EA